MTRSAVLLAGALLGGCGSVPRMADSQLPYDVPPGWSAAPNAASTHAPDEVAGGRWWAQFGDERLDEMIDAALRANLDLQRTAARLDASRAQARLAGADLWPEVALDGTAQRSRRSGVSAGSFRGGTTFATFSVGLSARWEVDVWGRLRGRKRAAVQDAAASASDLAAARLSLTAQTAKAYFLAVAARLQLDLAEKTVAVFRQTRDTTQRRYGQGIIPAFHLRLAASNLARAEALIERRRQELDTSLRGVQVLLGRYPDAHIELAPDLPDLPGPVPDGLPSGLLTRRPDLRAAFLRIEAADSRVRAAHADLFPRLSLTGSAGYGSDDLSNLIRPEAIIWNLLANLLQPLINGDRARAQKGLETARAREAFATYAQTVLTAFSEVETALKAEQFQREEIKHRQRAAEEATAARREAEERYDRGVLELLTVLDAQRRELDARSQLLQLRNLRMQNRVDLILALGGPLPDGRE